MIGMRTTEYNLGEFFDRNGIIWISGVQVVLIQGVTLMDRSHMN